jgi:phage-related baseplate assembly protein
MSNFTLDDLAGLPIPTIIQEPDYEALLAARKARIIELAPGYGLSYDVAGLETDPAVILAESEAYRELLLRVRGNDIARDNYLFFASGAGLDHKAAFYDVVRISGESDERLMLRIILAIQGRSTGGTAPRYRRIALEASLRVADAVVYTDGLSPLVNVAVFAADNNGIADAALLATVQAALNAEAVRMVNDTIIVRSAVIGTVNIVAALTLLPNASADIVTNLQAGLAAEWVAASGLGRDLTLDWLRARLMAPGVHSVAIAVPTANIIMQQFEAVRIGAVTLTIAGRAF